VASAAAAAIVARPLLFMWFLLAIEPSAPQDSAAPPTSRSGVSAPLSGG